MRYFLILLIDYKLSPGLVHTVLHACIRQKVARRCTNVLISMFFIRTVIPGQIHLHQLKSLVDKLLFSYLILRLALRSEFAQIFFLKFCLGKMKQF